MPQITIDGLRGLDPGEVFVKSSSHRATDAVERRLGYRPQTYYSFDRRKRRIGRSTQAHEIAFFFDLYGSNARDCALPAGGCPLT